jgi:hypothetical protein
LGRTEEYIQYITDHINEVRKQYNKYKPLFIKLFPEVFATDETTLYMDYIIDIHDNSKYSDSEFALYRDYYFPGPEGKISEKDFNLGWLHHIHNNPHHSQYWIYYDDENGSVTAYDIPDVHIVDLLCDWLAMSAYKKDTVWSYWESKGKDKIYSNSTKNKLQWAIYEIKKYTEENTIL